MKKGIKIILTIVLGIILIGGIISFIGPFLGITGAYFHDKVVKRETQLTLPEPSSVKAPDKLMLLGCFNRMLPRGWDHRENAEMTVYYDKLNTDEFDSVGVCDISKGKFVLQTIKTGISTIQKLYLDKNGELVKIAALETRTIKVALDSNGDVFFYTSFVNDAGADLKLYIYNSSDNSIKGVLKDKEIKVCNINTEGIEKCESWPAR